MCGIYGIYNTDGRPVDPINIRIATDTLRHRGPDGEGYLLCNTQTGRLLSCSGKDTSPELKLPDIDKANPEQSSLALGHRRLSIIDLSDAGHQPMSVNNGMVWIVYNGEIYNFIELRSELIDKGYIFQSSTDTEIVLNSYLEWGVDCLSHFNGMWSFAIWDQKLKRLFCSRDRFGIKPFYYTWDGAHFRFASEIKALVGSHGIDFAPNEASLFRYLTIKEMPDPFTGDTFFKNVNSLPSGHFLTVEDGKLKTNRYYFLDIEPDENKIDVNEAIHDFRELFEDSVRMRLISDVPVGTALSGGVDSSSIVSVIDKLMRSSGVDHSQLGERQKTFSAVYTTEGRYNEKKYIDDTLNVLNTDSYFVYPTSERLLDDLDELVCHQEEPFPSTSMFAQWCVMSEVQKHGVKVTLDGQGADEYLAGYRPFISYIEHELRKGHIVKSTHDAFAMQRITGRSAKSILLKASARLLSINILRQIRHFRAVKQLESPFLNSDFIKNMKKVVSFDDVFLRKYDSFSGLLRSHLLVDTLPNLLRYDDRNSMAFGVESRVPFLDYRLVEFTFKFAHPWRLHEGWTKWILRKAMNGDVPDSVLWRKDKIGFATPESDWMKEWLSRGKHKILADSPAKQFLNIDHINNISDITLKNKAGHTELWHYLSIDKWLKVWTNNNEINR
ncbi:asparagine synthase (glutamine-hydrolyzing) [bacterium]|nr:asparagine synthase (glutamine-hydrolyzing) [bacterium]